MLFQIFFLQLALIPKRPLDCQQKKELQAFVLFNSFHFSISLFYLGGSAKNSFQSA